jgi:hypothetical protein
MVEKPFATKPTAAATRWRISPSASKGRNPTICDVNVLALAMTDGSPPVAVLFLADVLDGDHVLVLGGIEHDDTLG